MVFNWFKKKKKEAEKSPEQDAGAIVEKPSGIKEEAQPLWPQEEEKAAPHAPVAKQEPPTVEKPEFEKPAKEKAGVEKSIPKTDGKERAEERAAEAPPREMPMEEDPGEEKKGVLARLKTGLAKTRRILNTDIEDLFSASRKIDDDFFEEMEERLITADVGVHTAMDLIEKVSKRSSGLSTTAEVKKIFKEELVGLLAGAAHAGDENKPRAVLENPSGKPHVVMVVGVNGAGKTTTIGKLAAMSVKKGRKTLIAAADTFRAAAVEQLEVWAKRAGADFVRHREKADPAAVAFDGVSAGISRGMDIVFVDTAGRLHTQKNLMEELKKIHRSVAKSMPGAPHEILLVLDATTGQNAISQAKLFNEALGVTSLVLTKLDGTAKGGVVVAICSTLNIPLNYIGIGEKLDDLRPFDPKQFVDALF